MLFLFLRGFGASPKLAFAMVAGALMSPFPLFNSGYIWPKMLSGAFGLAAAFLMFDAGSSTRRPLREDTAGFLLAAVLSALSLQSHGGAVFGVLAMLVIAPVLRGLPKPRDMIVAAALCAVILGPWMYYQHWIDPPGNALIKYAFAGTFGFGEEHMGVLDTIRRTYEGITFPGWLQSKWSALLVILVGGGTCGVGEQGLSTSIFDAYRSRDFLFVLPSLGLLVTAAILARILPRTVPSQLAKAGIWLAWGALSVVIGALLTLDCNINHTQSYQALLALHLGLLLVMTRNRKVLAVGLAVVIAYGVVVWIFDPLRHFTQWDGTAVLVAAVALVVAPLALLPSRPSDAVAQASG